MSSASYYIPLTATVAETYQQITSLPSSEKERQLKALDRLLDILLQDVMPKAIPQPNIALSATSKVLKQEVPYSSDSSSSLSPTYGSDYEYYDDEYHIRLKVVAANTASGTSDDNVTIWSRTLFISDCPISKVDQRLLADYLFVQAFFGPESEPLEVIMPASTPYSCSLCDGAAILSSRVHFKPHDTIEELAADLAFDGICLEV